MEHPLVTCECKKYEYGKWCGHCADAWLGVGHMGQMFATHHPDEKHE